MVKPTIKDYYIIKDDGSTEFNEEQYEKDLNSYVEETKRQASETAKKKGIDEGKKQAQNEANLSAEEKFAQRVAEFESQMKAKTIDFNKKMVKQIYKEKGFDDDTIDVLLNLVGEDETSSLDIANKLCDSRKRYEESYQKKFAEDVQKNQDSQSGSGSNDENMSFAKQMALAKNEEIKNISQNG